MKFKVINGEPLQFHNQNGDLTGTILMSGSGDMIIRPESGSNNNVIIGDNTTTGTVEFGTVAAPVTLNLLGGGTITSNTNTLYIGQTGDTVRINNAIFSQSLGITGSLRVSGSAYADYFVGDGSGLTNITASYLNPLNQNVVVTGSLTITNDLTVLGSSSIQYITSSQLNISDNIITVNTYSPAVRFGGLAVIDSGSTPQQSGSLLFDSQNNQWIFVHQSAPAAAVTSSVLIMGPQTFNNIGSETTLTANRIPKATGGDLGEHLTDSNITDTGTVVTIDAIDASYASTIMAQPSSIVNNTTNLINGLYSEIASDWTTIRLGIYDAGDFPASSIEITQSLVKITGSLSVKSGITGSLFGTASWANNALNANNGFPYTGSARITGSLGVTGSFQVQAYDASILGEYPQIDTVTKQINVPNTDVTYYASIDWGNQQLNTYDNSFFNTVTTVDWQGKVLNTAGSPFGITKPSVDWGNRYLRWGNTTVATPNISVDWGTGFLVDSSARNSVAWNTRRLINTSEATVLDWQTPGTLTVSASMVLSASVTASSGNSATSDAMLQATLLYLSNNF